MNELILSLAIKAKEAAEFYGMLSDAKEEEIFLEWFAFSIINECICTVQDAVDHCESASTYVSRIKQHFGVEQ